MHYEWQEENYKPTMNRDHIHELCLIFEAQCIIKSFNEPINSIPRGFSMNHTESSRLETCCNTNSDINEDI